MMMKVFVLGLALAFLLPMFPASGATNGGLPGGGNGRSAPDHLRAIPINDFSAMQMSELASLTGGGVGLQLGAGAWRPEFAVSSLAAKNKEAPAMAANSKNQLIITWEDLRKGNTDSDIYAQMFDPRGNPMGNEIAVCTATDAQLTPTIAVGSQDSFIIAWCDQRSGTGSDVWAQRFDGSGNKLGGNFQISTAGASGIAAMAVDSAGDYLVAWSDGRSYYMTYTDIYAQMLDRNGDKKGTEIPVTTAPGNQTEPSVACDARGRFTIAWQDDRDVGTMHLHAVRYDALSNTLGNDFVVSSAANYQTHPSVAVYPNDDFIVAWSDGRAQHAGIYAQKFDQNATQIGGELTAAVSDSDMTDPVVAINSSSCAFMAWMDWRTISGDIYGQWFDPSLAKSGPEVVVTGAAGQEREPAITIDAKDDMSVAWLDLRSGTQDVYARQIAYPYQTPGTLTTGELSGTNVWAWSAIAANVSMQNLSANTVSFELSTDGGVGWEPVPANGSLSAAGAAPNVRLRATLATTDDMSTPVLHNVTVSYISNLAPAAALVATPEFAIIGQQVELNASTSADPEGAGLAYDFSFGDGNHSGWVATPVVLHAYPVAGTYNATVSVRDDVGAVNSSALSQITVTTSMVPRLTVTNPKEGQVVNTTTLVVTFTVANYAITQTGGHIHYQLDAAGEVMWFSTLPFNITGLTEGNHVLKIYLADANHTRLPNPESYVTLNFTVGNLPQMPDLSISGTDIKVNPSSPKDGDSVTLSVTVHNTGSADADAFTVRFFVDGTALPDQNVVLLSKGGSKVVEVTWKAKSGSHNISVQVNPGGGLSEKTLSNNEASVKFSVAKAEAGGTSMLLIGVVILIMIVVVVALALMMMRRRKPTTVIHYQPPVQQAPAAFPPPAQGPPMNPSQMPPGPPQQPRA